MPALREIGSGVGTARRSGGRDVPRGREVSRRVTCVDPKALRPIPALVWSAASGPAKSLGLPSGRWLTHGGGYTVTEHAPRGLASSAEPADVNTLE